MNHPARRRHLASILVAAVTAIGTAVALSSPASAARPLGIDHFVLDETHLEQEAHEGFCPDVPFLVVWAGHSSITFKSLLRGKDGPEMFSFKISDQETYTNVDNGRTLTFLRSYGDGDRKLSFDGTIVSGVFAGHVSMKLFAPDGRLVGIDAGSFTETFTVDLVDPEDPDDDIVIEQTILDHGPRQLVDRDFCEDLLTYLS